MFDLIIPDAEAMESFGARLAPMLRAGDLVRLDGELGAVHVAHGGGGQVSV